MALMGLSRVDAPALRDLSSGETAYTQGSTATAATICILLFATFLRVYLIGINFPVYWHPDEIGKYDQIATRSYIYTHPHLLFWLAYFVKMLLGLGNDAHQTVLSGRIASAFSAALVPPIFFFSPPESSEHYSA
jgi:hypothetical protein